MIINDLDGYYIVFDTKNWNTELDTLINNIKTTITVPQVDFNLLKELAKKFGWVIQTEKKSGIEEALEDVKAGRVYHAKDAHDLIKQCLE